MNRLLLLLIPAALSCAAPRPAPAPPAAGDLVTFTGACDASGAVVLDGWLFAVGDDEDNFLRIYDGDAGGPPVARVDVSPMLGLLGKKKPPEIDVEAATGMGDVALWLASHGRKSSGKLDPARLKLFATTRVSKASELQLVGSAYEHLLEDLLAQPRLSAFGLEAAAQRAPKEEGGLNIEAMTESLDGRFVWIGFRSPLIDGKALLVPLLNPLQVVEGVRAQLGDPVLLELGGRGLRSLSTWRGRYLMIAGSTASGGRSALYAWDGASTPVPVPTALGDLNPEAFVTPEDQQTILLLSDDGTRPVGGSECKRLKAGEQKSFRGLRVRPGVGG